jgi:hypothetical protein
VKNQNRVPVTASLLAELADIRDRGNSPKVASEACIEAQKGFGPHPAHLEQLRATLPVTIKAQSKIIPFRGTGFTRLEIHTAHDTGHSTVERIEEGAEITNCPPYFWSLYGINLDGTSEAIGDFNSFQAACTLADKLQPCQKHTYKVGENIAAVSGELDHDKIYPFCDGGFPDLFQLSVGLGTAGEEVHGKAWESGEREWLDDLVVACRNLEDYVVKNEYLPASDFKQFWI